MSKLTKTILLLVILLTSIFLRSYNLGNVPASPDWDEAALGYNAYSIMLTGMDEYGEKLPVVLRSFDDYKPAAYAYTIIPFIKLIGLNIVSVRLPSVIFGVVATIAVYFLTRELLMLGKTKEELADRIKRKRMELVSLTAAMLFAVSPWSIQFSRIAFESNANVTLNILSLLFFLKGLKRYPYLLVSVGFASLNLYMYQSTKVFVPILFILLIAVFWKKLFSIQRRWLIASVLFGLIMVLPMVFYIATNQNALLRARGVSVFSDQTQFLKRNAEKIMRDKENKNTIGQLIDNRRIEYGKAIVSGYISHFDLNWLFITGDLERHHAPYMGLMYLVEMPFLLIGVYRLVFGAYSSKAKTVIFGYILLAPVAASVTSGVPHAVRTINFIPILQIITAVGLVYSFYFIFKKAPKVFSLFVVVFVTVSLFNFVYYLNQYFVQQNYFFSKEWQYGHKLAIDYIQTVKNDYDKVIVSNVSPLDQSYIFYLFYLKYDPKKYIESGGTVSGGFAESHRGFDKYVFRPINWQSEIKDRRFMYVGLPNDFPEGVGTLKKIYYLDGTEAIRIVRGE